MAHVAPSNSHAPSCQLSPPIRIVTEEFSHTAAKAARQFGAARIKKERKGTKRHVSGNGVYSVDGAGTRLTAAV